MVPFLNTFSNFQALFFLVITLLNSVSDTETQTHSEQLILRPLDRGQISAYFQFRTFIQANLDLPLQVDKHNDIFPLSLLQLFHRLEVQELHLSLTKGKWKHDHWGLPFREVAASAHLVTWFSNHHKAKDNLGKLSSYLSGQFCASINLISPTETVNPKVAFQPFLSNISRTHRDNHRHGYVALLPQEAICTENLTPWTKLLPCRSRKGLGSLLVATNIFNSLFISLSLDFRYSCLDISNCAATSGIELTQNIAVVFDSLPVTTDGFYSWTLDSLFGSSLQDYCHLAISSHVFIESNHLAENDSKLITPPTTYVRVANTLKKKEDISVINETSLVNSGDLVFADYDLKTVFEAKKQKGIMRSINLGAQYSKSYKEKLAHFSPVKVRRHARGYGVSSKGLSVIITNLLKEDVYATYLDIIPWYFRMYLHSLSIETCPLAMVNGSCQQIEPIWLHYEPAQNRIRPHHLEMFIRLPAQSNVEIRFNFEIQFFRWTEYPADAHHGLYISPANVIFYLGSSQPYEHFLPTLLERFRGELPANTSSYLSILKQFQPLCLFTEPTLLDTSVPDFSMPYNVNCFISTVIASFFSQLYKLTTLRFTIN